MKQKTLIILSILCVLVFVTYFIITNQKEKPQADEPTPYIYVDQNDPDSVRVFTFNASLQGEASFTYSSDSGWCLDHNEKIPLKDREVSALISTFSTVIASKKIDDPSSDLSQYGLDKPTYNVSIKISGKIKHYYFGNYHSTLNSYYFKTDQSKDIYLVPASYIEDLKVSIIDLLEPKELPDLENIESVEFTSVHGFVTQINNNSDHELISALSSLKIDYAVGFKEENYKTFSLDVPAVAKIEYLDENEDIKTLTLYLGRGKSDNITYILAPDTEIVCVLKCDNIDALLTAMDAKNN